MADSDLTGPKELVALWVLYALIVATAVSFGEVSWPSGALFVALALLGIVTGARVERYRGELKAKLGDLDGDD